MVSAPLDHSPPSRCLVKSYARCHLSDPALLRDLATRAAEDGIDSDCDGEAF